MTWRDRAACLGSDPDLFFSDAEDSVRAALAICAGCTVADECLEDALNNGDTIGLRGGIHWNHKNQPQRPPGRPRKTPVDYEQCGTNSGYQTHLRRKQTPCYACKQAHRDSVNDYRARKRKGAA